jgi:hypothetical protein
MPIDYTKGKIYCIRSPNTDLIYIGSTCQKLSQRMGEHRINIKKNNITSKIIFEYGDAYIELLENYPCNNKEELLKKEGEHIRSNNCCNKCIPSRTPKEYYEQYREKIKEYQKEYYEDNKEHKKEYRERNKEKQYYEDNKEKLKEYQKQYRERNKEEKLKEKINEIKNEILKEFKILKEEK